MHYLKNGSNCLPNSARRWLSLAALFAFVAAAAIVSVGCDPDDYNLGRDSEARSDRSSASTGPKYYANRMGQPIRLNSPEFLAPTDSGLEKAPRVADPDALVLSDDPLVARSPAAPVNLDTEDHLAGNFKFHAGYREPLLPMASTDRDSLPLGSDGLGMGDRQTASLKPSESDIAGPSGALGELQSQHKLREKYNLKHAIKLDPYQQHDYSRGTSDSENDDTSESIIRSDEATPAPPTPQAPNRP